MGIGVALADIPDRFSYRALSNWLHFAPSTSAYYRLTVGEAPWTSAEHRAADVADLLVTLIWLTIRVNSKSGRPLPQPLPRPSTTPPPSKGRPLAEIDAIIAENDRRDRDGTRRLRPTGVVK